MPNDRSKPIRLEFSDKYDRTHAQQYLEKHQSTLARRLSTWRDAQLARKALRLAGEPLKVLDLPCGVGRFWPTLLENPARTLIGADNSADMVAVARAAASPEMLQRIETLQTSAFAVELPDQSVDCVFSMRLLHHIDQADHRLTILREFRRVTRDTVVLSLWVDGNYKAWKRARHERKRKDRFVLPVGQVEAEFREAGFHVLGHYDFLPRYAMWRVYVLRVTPQA